MGNEPVKVLHIDTEYGWRGGQQQVAYLLEEMVKREFSTTLICQPDSKLEKFCLDSGLPCQPIKMLNEFDFFAGFRIAKICKKQNYQILHLHSSHSLAIGLWAKLFYWKLKLIAVRRVDFHIKKNLFSQFKYKTRLLDKIVCISDGIKNVLLEDNINKDKLVTIHSGISIGKFKKQVSSNELKSKLGIQKDHLVIGTVAAFAGHKDYPNLLKAAELVISQHSNVTFCAVGDGPEKEKIYDLAGNLNLKNRFIFAGFQEDIGQFLNMFDIFVLASKREGLGTSILDAQANGLPIVACRTGGIPEAVFDNENGLLVPPRDEKALAEALAHLIENEKSRQNFALQSKQTVKKFDIKNTVQKNIELYHSMI